VDREPKREPTLEDGMAGGEGAAVVAPGMGERFEHTQGEHSSVCLFFFILFTAGLTPNGGTVFISHYFSKKRHFLLVAFIFFFDIRK
jgi:hypothetical protein